MAVIYVARSKTLSDWGASVGISKNLFKVGTFDGDGKQALAALNEQAGAGLDDWKLVKADDAEDLTEADVLERLTGKITLVDPNYYPRIKREPGIFRIKDQGCGKQHDRRTRNSQRGEPEFQSKAS